MNNMISTFPNFITADSLFQKMVSMGAPWSEEVGKSMDISFFTMYSGLKTPSFFVSSNITNQIVNSQLIAQTLWDIYGKNWQKLWDAFSMEYNPLDNYNLTETVKRDETDNRNIGKDIVLSSAQEGNDKNEYTDNGTSTLTHGEVVSSSGEINDFTYAFNSSSHTPTADQITSATDTHSGDDKTVAGESGNSESTSTSSRNDTTNETTNDSSTINESITRMRAGIVGQNSYQELLRQQFELWKWNFYWQVFDDCDKFLCLSIYDPCSVK